MQRHARLLNDQLEESKTLSVAERLAKQKKDVEEAELSITVEDYDPATLVFVGVFATTLAGEIPEDGSSNVTEEFVLQLSKPLLMFLAEQVYEHSRPAKKRVELARALDAGERTFALTVGVVCETFRLDPLQGTRYALGDESITFAQLAESMFFYRVVEALKFRDMWGEFNRWEEDQDRDAPFDAKTMNALKEIRAKLNVPDLLTDEQE